MSGILTTLELPVWRDPPSALWHPWNARLSMRSLEKGWRRTLKMNFRGFGVRGCINAGFEGGDVSLVLPKGTG